MQLERNVFVIKATRIASGAVLAAASALGSGSAWSAGVTEMRGAQDPPLLSRYAGSTLVDVADETFASFPVLSGRTEEPVRKTVEGHVSAYLYAAPKDRTALEVFRNYQQALAGAGFKIDYTCEMRTCDAAGLNFGYRRETVGPRRWKSNGDRAAGALEHDIRLVSATLSKEGVDRHVTVFVAEPDSIWQAPAAVVLIVEPKPMQAGQVVVNTEQLKKGLADEGKIALYGLYFDTGKAEVKPESKAQLDQMAALLSADKSLKVAIVGHTDNVGAVDANLALSQRRAEAVVNALVVQYKVDAARLRARGVASFAPVASNRTDAGRARNRRVEMIEQ